MIHTVLCATIGSVEFEVEMHGRLVASREPARTVTAGRMAIVHSTPRSHPQSISLTSSAVSSVDPRWCVAQTRGRRAPLVLLQSPVAGQEGQEEGEVQQVFTK